MLVTSVSTEPKVILSIAGSDSCGGAGIQMDQRAGIVAGCHVATVITAVTAQNTAEVLSIHQVPAKEIQAQIQAVMSDMNVAAVKIGMIGSAEAVQVITEMLSGYGGPIVLDPVVLSSSGHALLSEKGLSALKNTLLPLATISTPNHGELALLTGNNNWEEATKSLLKLGAKNLCVTGGDIEGDEVVDRLVTATETRLFPAKKIKEGTMRGTGCLFSSLLACYLAQEMSLESVVKEAGVQVRKAMRSAKKIGSATKISIG